MAEGEPESCAEDTKVLFYWDQYYSSFEEFVDNINYNTYLSMQVENPICCKALTAECLACAEGVSVKAYCKANPDV